MKKHLEINEIFLDHLRLIFDRENIKDLIGDSEKHIYVMLNSFNEMIESNKKIEFQLLKKALDVLAPLNRSFNEKNNHYFNHLSPAFNSEAFRDFIDEKLKAFEKRASKKEINCEVPVDLRYIKNLLFFLNFSEDKIQKEVFNRLNEKYLITKKSVFYLSENKRTFMIKNITDEKVLEDIATKTLSSLFNYDFSIYKDSLHEDTLKSIMSDLKFIKNKAVLKNKDFEKFFTLILDYSCGKDDDLLFSCLNKEKLLKQLTKKKNICVESYDQKIYIEKKIKEYLDINIVLDFERMELHNFDFEDQIFIIKFAKASGDSFEGLKLKIKWFISDMKKEESIGFKDGIFSINTNYKELMELKYGY